MQSRAKTVKITVDGKNYQVTIQELGDGNLEVEVDGYKHFVSVAEVSKAVTTGGLPPLSEALAQRQAAATAPPSVAQPATHQKGALTAPMPGDIVEVLVKPGDKVSVGEPLCVLEAMKMKNILRSSQDGVVASVEAALGQTVEYGAVLVRFE